MKKTMTVFTALLMVFMIAGFGQAQIPGFLTVNTTLNGSPAGNIELWASTPDSSGSFPIMTGSNGSWVVPAIAATYPVTYTFSVLDTFTYNPQTQQAVVNDFGESAEITFDLTMRTQDVTISGSVVAEDGSDVAGMTVYMLKVPNDVNLDDFRQVETHFNIGPNVLRWASYATEIQSDGSYSVDVINGKYVMYIDDAETTLPHWGVFDTAKMLVLDQITLRTKKFLTGTVANTDKYDYVEVLGHSLNAGRPFIAVPEADGTYSMEVAPGDYILRVRAYFTDPLDNMHLYMVYYDDVHGVENATPVAVQDDVSGIDFTLPEAEAYPYVISGNVSSEAGDPIEGAKVAFSSYNFEANLFRGYTAETDVDGNYWIEAMTMLKEDSLLGFASAEGFFAEFYDGATTYVNATPILYGPDDTLLVNFALDTVDYSNAVSISGTLYDEDGNVIPHGQVTAFSTDTKVGVVSTQVDSMGNFTFDPVFTEHAEVYLRAWGGYDYLPVFYNNADTWEDAEALTVGTTDITGIDFVCKLRGAARISLASITGNISLTNGQSLFKANAEGNALEGAVVYVKPAGASEWTNISYVDNNGNYDLGVEQEGKYEVMVSAPGYQSWNDTNVDVDEDRKATLNITLQPTAIGDPAEAVISSHKLFSAYPNPFNPSTTIKVEMAKATDVTLTVYNVMGQKVKTLHKGVLAKGINEFKWNATNDLNQQIASGLYFYQLKSNTMLETKAVMFVK